MRAKFILILIWIMILNEDNVARSKSQNGSRDYRNKTQNSTDESKKADPRKNESQATKIGVKRAVQKSHVMAINDLSKSGVTKAMSNVLNVLSKIGSDENRKNKSEETNTFDAIDRGFRNVKTGIRKVRERMFNLETNYSRRIERSQSMRNTLPVRTTAKSLFRPSVSFDESLESRVRSKRDEGDHLSNSQWDVHENEELYVDVVENPYAWSDEVFDHVYEDVGQYEDFEFDQDALFDPDDLYVPSSHELEP